MKKRLLGLTASSLVLVAALTSCTLSSGNSSIGFSISSSDKTKDDSSKDSKKDGKTNKDGALSISDIAGSYHKTGHMFAGDYPDEYAPDNIEKKLKDDPMTISEDGTLHFCGKDYKLIAEGMDDEDSIFSVEGSGFNMKDYSSSSKVSSKDYEGPCVFALTVNHMTVNGEDYPYTEYCLLFTRSGSESFFGSISLDQGEASDDDWGSDFDWGDDEDWETVSSSDSDSSSYSSSDSSNSSGIDWDSGWE